MSRTVIIIKISFFLIPNVFMSLINMRKFVQARKKRTKEFCIQYLALTCTLRADG